MGYKNMMGLQPHLSRVTFTEITSRTTLFFATVLRIQVLSRIIHTEVVENQWSIPFFGHIQ